MQIPEISGLSVGVEVLFVAIMNTILIHHIHFNKNVESKRFGEYFFQWLLFSIPSVVVIWFLSMIIVTFIWGPLSTISLSSLLRKPLLMLWLIVAVVLLTFAAVLVLSKMLKTFIGDGHIRKKYEIRLFAEVTSVASVTVNHGRAAGHGPLRQVAVKINTPFGDKDYTFRTRAYFEVGDIVSATWFLGELSNFKVVKQEEGRIEQ